MGGRRLGLLHLGRGARARASEAHHGGLGQGMGAAVAPARRCVRVSGLGADRDWREQYGILQVPELIC